MQNLTIVSEDKWVRPWEVEQWDDLYNRDERFFSIVIKGMLSWLNKNIVLYNKSINHFIFNTGSSYMYVESNGYEYSWNETSGEDLIYMHMPRCVVEIGGIDFPTEELSSPFSRGIYERKDKDNNLNGYNAEMRRLPIEMSISLKYVLSNFNESIILLQELIDKIIFQKYFRVVYLGQVIECSIEYPSSSLIELNKIDMTSAETNLKNINLDIKICTYYPIIDVDTEMNNQMIISSSTAEINTNYTE